MDYSSLQITIISQLSPKLTSYATVCVCVQLVFWCAWAHACEKICRQPEQLVTELGDTWTKISCVAAWKVLGLYICICCKICKLAGSHTHTRTVVQSYTVADRLITNISFATASTLHRVWMHMENKCNSRMKNDTCPQPTGWSFSNVLPITSAYQVAQHTTAPFSPKGQPEWIQTSAYASDTALSPSMCPPIVEARSFLSQMA